MAMKKTIEDYDLKGKKVIIRCDFNVPIKDGIILDDTRIKESIETIQYAIDHQAKVILLSHLGKVKEPKDIEKNNLAPVAVRLSELLGQNIVFVNETRGQKLEEEVENLTEKNVLLVQNTRYEDLEGKKESTCDEDLASYWASLGDIFINDAFGTIHRAHASNVGIASHLPNGIGFLVEKELKKLEVLNEPVHPYYVILGGAKVKDKVGTIQALVQKADKILIGGGMALTFLKAKGYDLGNSLIDEESIPFCKEMLEKYEEKIILPIDLNVAKEGKNESIARTLDTVQSDEKALDIGEKTVEFYQEIVQNAKTIMWNGPLGVYEIDDFAQGTNHLLQTIVSLPITTILGGGDIVAAATKIQVKDKVTHASTGGGATLEYLEGKVLPGLEVIQERG